MLTGIGLIMRSLYQELRAERHPAAEEALHIIKFLREADQFAKDLSQGLLPVDGDDTGLWHALQRLAAFVAERYRVACEYKHSGAPLEVRDHVAAAHLYQIAHDSAVLICRYRRPHRIRILLTRQAAQARLTIRHDGPEASASDDQDPMERWQNILEYRARITGAFLRIHRNQRGGSITCVLPIGDRGVDAGPSRVGDSPTPHLPDHLHAGSSKSDRTHSESPAGPQSRGSIPF